MHLQQRTHTPAPNFLYYRLIKNVTQIKKIKGDNYIHIILKI